MRKPAKRKAPQPPRGSGLHHTVPVLLRSALFASRLIESRSKGWVKEAREAEAVRRSCHRMIRRLHEFPAWIPDEFMRRTIAKLETIKVQATAKSQVPPSAQADILETFKKHPVLQKEAEHATRISRILHSERRQGRPPEVLVGVRDANLWMLTEELDAAGVKRHWKVAAALLREDAGFPSSFRASNLRGLINPFRHRHRGRLDALRQAFRDYLHQTLREHLDEELRAMNPAFRSMIRETWRGRFCASCGARMLPEEVGRLCRLCRAQAPKGPKGFQ